MTFGEKIQLLRKQHGLSQEDLAGKMEISRQTVSKWENENTVPDSGKIVKLSKLFSVSTDYLLLDDVILPPTTAAKRPPKKKYEKLISALLSLFGLLGNFIIYVASRFVEVMIPYITKDANDKTWYNWSSNITGISYKYFIKEYELEFLCSLFWIFTVAGIAMFFIKKDQFFAFSDKIKGNFKSAYKQR